MTRRARGAPGVLVLLSTLGLGAAVLQTESGCGLCLPGHDYVDIYHGAIGVDGSCVDPEDEPVFDRCYW